MNPSATIFVDASFWVAFRDRDDLNHREALEIAGRIVQQRWRLVSTWLVFAETHAPFARSLHRKQQILNDFTENPLMHLEEIVAADRTEALALLRQQGGKDYSLCDAISFAVIRRLGLLRAASFDDCFRQLGNIEVLG